MYGRISLAFNFRRPGWGFNFSRDPAGLAVDDVVGTRGRVCGDREMRKEKESWLSSFPAKFF